MLVSLTLVGISLTGTTADEPLAIAPLAPEAAKEARTAENTRRARTSSNATDGGNLYRYAVREYSNTDKSVLEDRRLKDIFAERRAVELPLKDTFAKRRAAVIAKMDAAGVDIFNLKK